MCLCLLLGCPKKEEEGPSPEDRKAIADGTYLQATQAFLAGNYDEAQKLLEEVKKLTPSDPRLPAAEAEILLGQLKLTEALAAFEKAAKLDPRRATNHSRIGYIHSLKGNREGAVASLNKAIELNPNDYNALELLGDVSIKDGKIAEGAAYFLKAAEVAPEPMRPVLVMKAAQEQARGGLSDNALQTEEDAWKRGLKSVEMLTDLGDRMVEKGRHTDAVQVYTEAAQLSGDDPTIWELVGELYVRLDKPADAEAAFRQSLKVKDRGVVHVALARLCEKRKEAACVKAELDLALEKATGEETREVTELAELLSSVGRHADAAKLLGGFASEEGNQKDGRLQLRAAQFAKAAGAKDQVKELCDRALASDAGIKKCP